QLVRAPGRNAGTISAMMVGIAIMVGVGTMIASFRETVQLWIDQTVMADLVVAPVTWLQGDEAGVLTSRLPLEWSEDMRRVPGVAAVDPYREIVVDVGGRPVSLIARELRVHAARSRYLFRSGDPAEIFERALANGDIVISEVLARTQRLAEGDALTVLTPSGPRTFRIAGVFFDYATDGGKLVMDRAVYRRFWNDETATVLGIYLEPGIDAQAARRRVEARAVELGGAAPPMVMSNRELKQEVLAIFDRTFQVTYGLEAIAVVIALLGIINTLLTSVLERQRELATLRAVGASRSQIRGLVLWESAYLGVLGGVLGVVGGIALSVLLVKVINTQSFGWSIRWSLQPSLL